MRLIFSLLLMAGTGLAAVIPGDFVLERPLSGDKLVLKLVRADTLVDPNRSIRVTPVELAGFDPATLDSQGTAIRFEMKRTAGSFVFEGTAVQGRITGKFRFQESAEFAARLKGVISNWWDPGVLFEFAVNNLNSPVPQNDMWMVRPLAPRPVENHNGYLKALNDSGYTILPSDAARLRSFGVQPDILKQLKSNSQDLLVPNDLIWLKLQGITVWDLQNYKVRGYSNLPVDDLVRLKTQGIPNQP